MLAIVLRRLQGDVLRRSFASLVQPEAIPTYAIMALQLVAAAILFAIAGFSLPVAALLAMPLWPLFLCAGSVFLRRYNHPRMCGWLEATGLVYFQGVSTLLLLIPLTAFSGPFADERLAAADRALGFDWPAFAHYIAHSPSLTNCVVLVYNSFAWQPFLMIGGLFAARREGRAWQAVTAGAVAALITAIIYPLTPAVGAYIHFGLDRAEFARFGAGWQFGPVLSAIKNDGVRSLTAQMIFTGYVSFPSYHAAVATIFAWSMWPFQKARMLFVPLNVAMVIVATVGGGHYFVDVIGGTVVAACAIVCAKRLVTEDQAPRPA